MADGDIGFEATNLFNFGAGFRTQSSRTSVGRSYALVLDANGDKGCEDAFNVTTNYTQSTEFCGSDLISELGTFLTTFGAVQNSILPVRIVIGFSNLARPTVSADGHQHAVNAHTTGLRQFDVSGVLGASITGQGIPTLGATGNLISFDSASACTGATYTFAFEHMDVEGSGGDHFAGENRTCRIDVAVEGKGASGDVTLGANWAIDDADSEDGNTAADTFAVTAHQYIDAI